MLDLFKIELENNAEILSKGLLALESNPNDLEKIESLMRAAHSLKGAAKILQLELFVNLAHVMEDLFVSIQEGNYIIDENTVDVLLKGNDIFLDCAKVDENEIPNWLKTQQKVIDKVVTLISNLLNDEPEKLSQETKVEREEIVVEQFEEKVEPQASKENIDYSMISLLKIELENQSGVLNKGLLILENEPNSITTIEELMRASHSIKGAAKILGFDSIVNVAHLMEDYFVSLQDEKISLQKNHIDNILSAVDIFSTVSDQPEKEISNWLINNKVEIDRIILSLSSLSNEEVSEKAEKNVEKKDKKEIQSKGKLKSKNKDFESDRVLRVSTESLNKLMGLASESLVDSKKLESYVTELIKIKNTQAELSKKIEKIQDLVTSENLSEKADQYLTDIQNQLLELKNTNSTFISDFEIFTSRSSNLSNRLYREVLLSRMRPFEEGVNDFPRMVRDLGRQLNKKVSLEIEGAGTKVDRDILEKLKAPLTHLIRNAVDHGIEKPEQRINNNKDEEGILNLSATHRAGMLFITLTDNGNGIDLGKIRKKIIDKNYVTEDMSKDLSDSEITDFLFLPGFSTSQNVTDISGRGVGLDVVQNMIQEVGGIVRVESVLGKGTTFRLQLPITLSVVRTLILDVSKEAYAIPLTRIEYAIKLRKDKIKSIEGKQYFEFQNEKISLVKVSQLLGYLENKDSSNHLFVVVISDRINKYGLVVDDFLGERDLVVHRFDPRLGKVKDISSASILENGDPVLIFDIEDLVKSVDDLLNSGGLSRIKNMELDSDKHSKKKVLVVDDSITVREVEKKLLESYGYNVKVAVNGMDGWNAVRSEEFDLIISDIDMPRMNGFELVTLIRKNEKTIDVPIIIVSYKDREEDKIKGMEAGANYYLTKSSFHDDTFIEAVQDLIGEAER